MEFIEFNNENSINSQELSYLKKIEDQLIKIYNDAKNEMSGPMKIAKYIEDNKLYLMNDLELYNQKKKDFDTSVFKEESQHIPRTIELVNEYRDLLLKHALQDKYENITSFQDAISNLQDELNQAKVMVQNFDLEYNTELENKINKLRDEIKQEITESMRIAQFMTDNQAQIINNLDDYNKNRKDFYRIVLRQHTTNFPKIQELLKEYKNLSEKYNLIGNVEKINAIENEIYDIRDVFLKAKTMMINTEKEFKINKLVSGLDQIVGSINNNWDVIKPNLVMQTLLDNAGNIALHGGFTEIVRLARNKTSLFEIVKKRVTNIDKNINELTNLLKEVNKFDVNSGKIDLYKNALTIQQQRLHEAQQIQRDIISFYETNNFPES